MNWVGDLCQKYIQPDDTVLDLGCGIMQATLDTIPTYPKTRLKCREIFGVEIYRKYLDMIKHEKNVHILQADLRKPLPLKSKCVDIVLLLDVIEHLPSNDALFLLRKAEDLARKKVIVLTPSNWNPNEGALSSYDLGCNPFQKHQWLVKPKMLKNLGYTVKEIRKEKSEPYSYSFAVKRVQLRILHVWDQAGVAVLMAIYQRKLGHQADIIMAKEFDSHCYVYGFSSLSSTTSKHPKLKQIYTKYPVLQRLFLGTKRLISRTKRLRRTLRFYSYFCWLGPKYDILHIHSVYRCSLLLPWKPCILEFHGDDVRDNPSYQSRLDHTLVKLFIRLCSVFGKKLFVSTLDLKREIPKATWIPNPVDLNLFRPRNKQPSNHALYTHNWYESGQHAIDLSTKNGWKLRFFDRARPANKWIPHEHFADFLSQFDYFIDRKNIPSLSKTALEALAMGLTVVRWDGEMLRGLDERHYPENVASLTITLYLEKLKQ